MKNFFLFTLTLIALISCSSNSEKQKTFEKGSVSIHDIFKIHATNIASNEVLRTSISITYNELLAFLSPESKTCFLNNKGGDLEKQLPLNEKNNTAFFQKIANNNTYKMLDFIIKPQKKESCGIRLFHAYILYTLKNEKLFAICNSFEIGDKVFLVNIQEMGKFSDYGVTSLEELSQ